MDTHLQGLSDFTLVYLDDVLIFSEDEARHQDYLRQVFERFRDKRMRIKASKCLYATPQISFLGHEVSERADSRGRVEIRAVGRMATPVGQSEGSAAVLGVFCHITELLFPTLQTLPRR